MTYSIRYLVDHTEHVDTVANWYWTEWDQHENWSIERSRQFTQQGLNKKKLDVILIAINDNNQCCGTIQIRKEWGIGDRTPEDLKKYSPWLGSLYVAPNARGKRLGFNLCIALEKVAKDIGVKKCYAATSHLDRFFQRKNGDVIDETNFANEHMRIYEFTL